MLAVVLFFFFQAEDGIRDLVRSRGLGDVYKRQARRGRPGEPRADPLGTSPHWPSSARSKSRREPRSVSYTHLTLPTSDLV